MDGALLFQANLDAETAEQAVTIDSLNLAFSISDYNVLNKTLPICLNTNSPPNITLTAIASFLYIRASEAFTLTLTKGNSIQTNTVDRFFLSAAIYDSVVIANLDQSNTLEVKVIYT